jgi:hypothetical protein
MSAMSKGRQCHLCGAAGHMASNCDELAHPLKDGFQGGGGGGGGHSHDDEDERLSSVAAKDERLYSVAAAAASILSWRSASTTTCSIKYWPFQYTSSAGSKRMP